MDQKLLHAAYGIARTSIGAAEAKGHLVRQFPSVEWDDIVEAYKLGAKLHEQSYEAGLLWHNKKLSSEDEGINRLRTQCPGFSEETYLKAWSDGVFESMW